MAAMSHTEFYITLPWLKSKPERIFQLDMFTEGLWHAIEAYEPELAKKYRQVNPDFEWRIIRQ